MFHKETNKVFCDYVAKYIMKNCKFEAKAVAVAIKWFYGPKGPQVTPVALNYFLLYSFTHMGHCLTKWHITCYWLDSDGGQDLTQRDCFFGPDYMQALWEGFGL